MTIRQRVMAAFREQFHRSPALLARGPGRVNLIGEHTDYNDGFVMPMAIDRAIWIALHPRQDRTVSVHSLMYDQRERFSLDHLEKGPPGWIEYLKGVAWAMQEAGYTLQGFDGIVAGDVPFGAGLSSSAALEMASARAFAAISGIPWEPANMAMIGQRAENEWVGVQCGIMDQMISAAGQTGHALLIDCRTLETTPVPLPAGISVVILDTATRRGLLDSAYNERRAQCEAAARFFGVPALRDVSMEQFQERAGQLDDLTRRRARHVISENERTLAAVDAMLRSDPAELGRLFVASHASLRDDFEVSSSELDTMVDCALKGAGCYGARMTGAGFGGCAVALVRAETARSFASEVATCYQKTTGLSPHIYLCAPANGVEVIDLASEVSAD